MAIYSIHNSKGAPPEQAVFVRDGFSFGAFLFTFLWAAWHRMWVVAGVLLAITGALTLAGNLHVVPGTLLTITSLAVSFIFGCEARGLQRRALIASGKAEVGLTHGRRAEEAELRYYLETEDVPAAASTAVTSQRGPDSQMHDAIGIFGKM